MDSPFANGKLNGNVYADPNANPNIANKLDDENQIINVFCIVVVMILKFVSLTTDRRRGQISYPPCGHHRVN